jgi:predicted nucleic acid-binding protein
MLVFCDTSALYAVGNRDDESHAIAARVWQQLIADRRFQPITTNYVVVETFSLAHRRRGLQAARAFAEALAESVEIAFVDEGLHQSGTDECLQGRKRNVSLVDYVSFAFMRRHAIRTAFAFDRHFINQGFKAATTLL